MMFSKEPEKMSFIDKEADDDHQHNCDSFLEGIDPDADGLQCFVLDVFVNGNQTPPLRELVSILNEGVEKGKLSREYAGELVVMYREMIESGVEPDEDF